MILPRFHAAPRPDGTAGSPSHSPSPTGHHGCRRAGGDIRGMSLSGDDPGTEVDLGNCSGVSTCDGGRSTTRNRCGCHSIPTAFPLTVVAPCPRHDAERRRRVRRRRTCAPGPTCPTDLPVRGVGTPITTAVSARQRRIGVPTTVTACGSGPRPTPGHVVRLPYGRPPRPGS